MASLFGDFVTVEPKKSPWDYGGEIEEEILNLLAQDVQTRLRSRLDVGFRSTSSGAGHATTVRAEDGRLVIHAEEEPQSGTTIDDLFRSTSESPYIENNKLVFRKIREQDVKKKNDKAVRSSFEEAVHLNLGRHVEEAIRKVKGSKPEFNR